METNKDICLMGQGVCKLAGTEKCNSLCNPFIQLHGVSGKGGRVGLSNSQREHRLINVHTSPVRPLQPENYAVIDKYLHRLFEPRRVQEEQLSLYLWSENPGTGKTTTATAIMNSVLIKKLIKATKEGAQLEQRPVYFLDTNEWQTLYNNATRPHVPAHIAEGAWDKYYSMMNIASTVPFLVADDIGVRSITEAHRADLHSIINARISESLPTIYTSNISIAGLPEVFGEQRLYDRMRQMTLELHFTGESQRGLK